MQHDSRRAMTARFLTAKLAALIASLLVLVASAASGAANATIDDTAKLLAGMQPAEGSPLAPLMQRPGWQQHARSLDAAWKDLERRQLSRIRVWSSRNLPEPQPVMFYMFSGPDFLYADTFFPNASTYVLSGLEPVGHVPDLTRLPHGSLARGLSHLQTSLGTILNYSFFITQDMRVRLQTGEFTGTLPVLYVFLARAGKTIREVSFVNLDKEGRVQTAVATGRPSAAPGVKIVFAGSDSRNQTLYYFSTDLSNGGVTNSGFLKFCEQLGSGDSLIKSASYLLHSGSFSKVRDFLLAHSASIVQDDSGIPVSYFTADGWVLRPFGSYRGPISIFSQHHQAKLSRLFEKGRASPIDFGIGYRWRAHETNLLLAVRMVAKASNDP
jgi:hypothetical protein